MDAPGKWVQERLDLLPPGLREHVERVRALAGDLAARHGVEREPVDLGAMAHDLARAMTGDALLAEARRLGIRVRPVEERTPILLHGPVAARWLEDTGGLRDEQVVQAVRWHTTGNRGMGPAAKVVYLADKLEPDKVRREPGLEGPLALAHDSVDEALLALVDHQIASLLRQRYSIHPASIEMRNELLAGLGHKSGRSTAGGSSKTRP